ncbi:carbohydrate kinase family protein [Paenibacillus sp. GCM10027626]|uniref:carbohydrate kinase family protein n=1 Tax=Paenibacillus sp. GCM10027626 TaxID=3273411 RepID=UPI0036372D46
MMKYAIISTAVTDEIEHWGSADPAVMLGGAGTYALAGVKVWTDDVALLTGVGADFAGKHGGWFEANGLRTEHLLVKAEHTPTTRITYFEDGERVETPVYGPEHYRLMEASLDEIRASLGPKVKGVYIFKEAIPEFWDDIGQLKRELGFTLLWEINADSAVFSQVAAVKRIAENVDIFSINRTEARALLQRESIDELIAEFQSWRTPHIFLRDGGRGAYMIGGQRHVHVPPVENVLVADATGGGNSSSAGVLYGICEGYSPYDAGVIGSISASVCLEQQGVPMKMDRELRERAVRLFNKMGRNEHEKSID